MPLAIERKASDVVIGNFNQSTKTIRNNHFPPEVVLFVHWGLIENLEMLFCMCRFSQL